MDKKAVIELRKNIFNHIVTNRDSYKNFSSEQKIEFSMQAFENVNALCAALWGTNLNKNHFWFMFGKNANAFADSIGQSGFVVLSSKVAINLKKSETVYRLLLHELRHLYQQQELSCEQDRESMSYYHEDDKTHAAWAASPCEKGANGFAYSELFKILLAGRKGFLKSNDRVSALKVACNLSKMATSCFFDHATGTVRYALDKKFDCFRKSSTPLGVGEDEDFCDRSGFISPNKLLNVMAQNPEIFRVNTTYNQEIHKAIADAAGDGFQDLMDASLADNQIKAPNITSCITEDIEFVTDKTDSVRSSCIEEIDDNQNDSTGCSLYEIHFVKPIEQENLEQN